MSDECHGALDLSAESLDFTHGFSWTLHQITSTISTHTGLHDVLSRLYEDSVNKDSSLLWPDGANSLAETIIGPYEQSFDTLPTTEEENYLKDIMIRLFGNPSTPEARWRWANIEEKFKRIVEHWLQGRQLVDSFEFIKQITSTSGTPRAHWTERERFWTNYWKAGRLRQTRVYIKDRLRKTYQWSRLNKSLYQVYKNSGKLYGGNSGRDQMVLMMQIDDDILILEVNYNGRLHIGNAANKSRSTYNTPNFIGIWKDELNYSYEVVDFGTSISHFNGWQFNASQVIQELSGLPIPAGARR